MIIERGKIIVVTSGSYSDYNIIFVGKANMEIDTEKIEEEYRLTLPEEKRSGDIKSSEFAKWITIDKGYVEEIDYSEWDID